MLRVARKKREVDRLADGWTDRWTDIPSQRCEDATNKSDRQTIDASSSDF